MFVFLYQSTLKKKLKKQTQTFREKIRAFPVAKRKNHSVGPIGGDSN